MRALLDANLWDGMLFEDMFDMQATMVPACGRNGPNRSGVRKEAFPHFF